MGFSTRQTVVLEPKSKKGWEELTVQPLQSVKAASFFSLVYCHWLLFPAWESWFSIWFHRFNQDSAFEQTKRKFWLTDNTNKVHGKLLKIPCLIQPVVLSKISWTPHSYFIHITRVSEGLSLYCKCSHTLSLSLNLCLPPFPPSLPLDLAQRSDLIRKALFLHTQRLHCWGSLKLLSSAYR